MIQTNVPNSEEVLISALFGITLPSLLLAYRLNIFNVFKTINDQYKIIIPSFHKLYRKLLSNSSIAGTNKSYIKDFQGHQASTTPLDKLKKMEDIKVDLIELETFQGLIPLEMQLANSKIMISADSCKELIENFNTKLDQLARDEKKEEDLVFIAIRDLVKRLSEDTDDFLDYHKKFLDAVHDIKNFFV